MRGDCLFKLYCFKFEDTDPGYMEDVFGWILNPDSDDIACEVDPGEAVYAWLNSWGMNREDVLENIARVKHDTDESIEDDVVDVLDISECANGSWVILAVPKIYQSQLASARNQISRRTASMELLYNTIGCTTEEDILPIMQTVTPFRDCPDLEDIYEIIPSGQYLRELAQYIRLRAKSFDYTKDDLGIEYYFRSEMDKVFGIWAWYQTNIWNSSLPKTNPSDFVAIADCLEKCAVQVESDAMTSLFS